MGGNPVNWNDPNGLAARAIGNAATQTVSYFASGGMADLFPQGAPIVTTGQAFGALAAYAQGVATGNSSLTNVAIQGMAENKQNNLDTLIMLGTLGKGGAKAGVINEGAGGAVNRATFEAYKDSLRAQMEKPPVSDPSLSGLINDLYRPGAKIGSGSTADAVRYEQATGQPVGNVFHTGKAQGYSTALQKWIDKNPTASPGDRAAAENVLRDLQNALSGR